VYPIKLLVPFIALFVFVIDTSPVTDKPLTAVTLPFIVTVELELPIVTFEEATLEILDIGELIVIFPENVVLAELDAVPVDFKYDVIPEIL
jgi:hypothetical protein